MDKKTAIETLEYLGFKRVKRIWDSPPFTYLYDEDGSSVGIYIYAGTKRNISPLLTYEWKIYYSEDKETFVADNNTSSEDLASLIVLYGD